VAVVAAVAAAVEAVPGEAVSAVVGWASHARVAPGAVDAPVLLAAHAPVLDSDAADAEASLEAVLAALPAEAVEAAAVPAGFGPQLGAGSIVAGVALHLRVRHLLSRRSNPHRQQRLQEKVTGTSSPHEPNSVRRCTSVKSCAASSGRFATFAAIRRARRG
jgi:hypothetical protein